jgi:hypothetical protein
LTLIPWNSTSPIREPPDRLWPEANQPSGKKAVFVVPPLTVNEFELYVPLWLPIIDRQDVAGAVRIVRRERLGGLLSFYHRKTAVRERIE